MNFIITLVKCIIASSLLFIFSCSSGGDIAGTGSSTGNAKVVGTILDNDNNAVQDVQVYLIPPSFDPCFDSKLPDSLIDTTDEEGRFSLPAVDSGVTYNLYAVNPDNNTKLFAPGITLDGDSIDLSKNNLKNPGVVKVVLPDSVDTARGCVYIPGTPDYIKTSGNILYNAGNYILYLPSVPSAAFKSIILANMDNPDDVLPINDNDFTVLSNDTVTVGTWALGVVYNAGNSGLPDNGIYCAAIDNDGSKWFAGYSSRVAHFNDTSWKVYNVAPFLDFGSSILSVAVDHDGTKWFGSHCGVLEYNGTSWKVYNMNTAGLPNGAMYSIAIDGDNNKWISVNGYGVIKYDGVKWTKYNLQNSGLPSSNVSKLAIGHDNSVWIPTRRGLVNFNGTSWTTYNTSNSPLPIDTLSCVAVDKKGHIWIGSNQGDVVKFDGTNWEIFNTINSILSAYQIHNIKVDHNNEIWVGTERGQLYKYDHAEWSVFNSSNTNIPAQADHLYTIAIDSLNNKWVTMDGGGVIVFGPELNIFYK